ncbi:hypothetical protein BGZ65_005349, partial [Modicella reniformis]
MTHKPMLAIQHKLSLSVGGIVRYRIKLLPSQVSAIESLQFCIRNCSVCWYIPGSGTISVTLVRNPDKTPAVPELVPSIGARACRLDAIVDHDDKSNNQADNMWELEVLSEIVLKRNWVHIEVEVYIVFREGVLEPIDNNSAATTSNGTTDDASDVAVQPQVLLPNFLSCDYKDTEAICGPTFPERTQHEEAEDNDLHLVLLTHGIHGTWLDMLYIKEQIDAHNAHNGKTVTFLTDTNHAGTEEGIQMAGQRVALDILEFTGYCETEHGKDLSKSRSNTTTSKESAPENGEPIRSARSENRCHASKTFPRGFSKVSIIGHSLGGLINIYALGYIEDMTKGAFFKTIQPAHFITLATPLLGIGFEHPWVLGFALSLGVIGQTGKDLSLGDRSSKLKRSASLSSSSSSLSKKRSNINSGDKELVTSAHATTASNETLSPLECSLDGDAEPLLLAMARPDSASHRVLRQFKGRTSYANIENDMAVGFMTSSMMGIPTFDIDHFFSPEGAATQPRRNFYYSALISVMALLFPNIPTKAKFLEIADAPSPIVVVNHVEANPLTSSTTLYAKSKLDLANLVAEGYQTNMDWTKIGVFIEHEAHVQIVVRRKWYNLDGWKCVQGL